MARYLEAPSELLLQESLNPWRITQTIESAFPNSNYPPWFLRVTLSDPQAPNGLLAQLANQKEIRQYLPYLRDNYAEDTVLSDELLRLERYFAFACLGQIARDVVGQRGIKQIDRIGLSSYIEGAMLPNDGILGLYKLLYPNYQRDTGATERKRIIVPDFAYVTHSSSPTGNGDQKIDTAYLCLPLEEGETLTVQRVSELAVAYRQQVQAEQQDHATHRYFASRVRIVLVVPESAEKATDSTTQSIKAALSDPRVDVELVGVPFSKTSLRKWFLNQIRGDQGDTSGLGRRDRPE